MAANRMVDRKSLPSLAKMSFMGSVLFGRFNQMAEGAAGGSAVNFVLWCSGYHRLNQIAMLRATKMIASPDHSGMAGRYKRRALASIISRKARTQTQVIA